MYLDDKTGTLFAFQRLAGKATDYELSKNDIVQKWWRMMKTL
jgi:L-rhamnose mutarotase